MMLNCNYYNHQTTDLGDLHERVQEALRRILAQEKRGAHNKICVAKCDSKGGDALVNINM